MFESYMTKEQQLRKHQNDMVVIGGGIIVFALWGVMRYLLVLFYLDTETFTELNKLAKADPKNAALYYSMILTVIAIQLALIIVIRFFFWIGCTQ